MGSITSILKGQATSAIGQIKGMNVENEINSRLKSANIDFQLPDLEVPDSIKNFKLDVDTSSLKLPAGIDSHISPMALQLMSHINLPSEIGGFQLPQIPDISSITSEVNGLLSGFGIDTQSLGIGDISNFIQTPDLSSISNISFKSPIDLNSIPDITSSLDDFDVDGIQSQIDGIDNIDIDISKYF